MNQLKKIATFSFVAAAVMASAVLAGTVMRANLTGAGKGKVVWKVRDSGSQFQAELEGESERLPRNLALVVTIGNNPSIAVVTNNFGTFRFSQRFNTSTRPTINAGDTVTVANLRGAVIQTGTMVQQ